MKFITPLRLIVVIVLGCCIQNTNAQNYDFTLVQNSDYTYTISAVSLYDSFGFQPITQSYGFVLVLPDGVTITVDDVMPSGTNETVTAIPGTNVSALDPSMSDKDLFQIISDTSGGALAAHGNSELIPLVTITVNGNPTSGEIRLLSNTSILASSPALNGALDAFFQVDVSDDSTVNFNNEFNILGGNEAYGFETLSIADDDEVLSDISLYPNPAKTIVQLRGDTSKITFIEVFDSNGKVVLSQIKSLERIDVSSLQSAMYLVKLHTDTATKTIKLVKY